MKRTEVHDHFETIKARAELKFGIRLTRWRLGWENTASTLGRCHYSKKLITINVSHLNDPDDQIINTISHEIAHAVAGWDAGHGAEWKRVHRALGGDGERCGASRSTPLKPYKYHVIDTRTGDFVCGYHRKPKYNIALYTRPNDPDSKGKLILKQMR